jgi:hypothetical protein
MTTALMAASFPTRPNVTRQQWPDLGIPAGKAEVGGGHVAKGSNGKSACKDSPMTGERSVPDAICGTETGILDHNGWFCVARAVSRRERRQCWSGRRREHRMAWLARKRLEMIFPGHKTSPERYAW